MLGNFSLGNHCIQKPGNPFVLLINPLVPTRQEPQQKENFRQTTIHTQNTKYNYLSPWYYFSLHYVIIIIYFDVGIYSLLQISFMFKNRPPPFVIFLVTFTYVKINFDQYLQLTSLKFCIKAKKRCYPLIVIYMKAMWK